MVKDLVEQALFGGYPQALQIKATAGGRLVCQNKWGKNYKFFDLGSLTKIMVTTPLVMMLWEDGVIDLNAPISNVLGFLSETKVGRIPIKNLLRHISGLQWWKPFYEDLRKLPWVERNFAIKNQFRKEQLNGKEKCVYSDLDFILLGWLVETCMGLPLDEAARLFIFKPLGLNHTFFIRHDDHLRVPREMFAPTEKHAFRGVLQRTVFDDNAWSMGGVSGHAGVFSTLEDVSRFGEELLAVRLGKQRGLWKPATMKYFTSRAVTHAQGDWALGFVIPSRPVSTGTVLTAERPSWPRRGRPSSTAGTKVSSSAFGHTGYTGTSLWIDPKRKAVVTILSNRTFPTRKDERFLNLRRQLHDAVWERIDE